jgi:peptide/nickel transport system permease protein
MGRVNMGRYAFRRLIGAIPVFIGVIIVVFILTTIVPGDPARIMAGQAGKPETIAKIRREMGLDDPILVQMWRFFKSAITFNLGRSYRNNMDVNEAIWSRFPATVRLGLAGMVIAIVLGMTFGIISAVKQYSFLDYASMFVALLGISAPSFWVGLLLIYLFAVTLLAPTCTYLFNLGSRASRRPSPSKLNPRTVREIAAPGNTDHHHWPDSRYSLPWLII